jgi:hypothetical protein
MATRKTSQSISKTRKAIPLTFHERFEIDVGIDEAKNRFLNRVKNYIFRNYLENDSDGTINQDEIRWHVANALGDEYEYYGDLDGYVRDDFYRCLLAIEASYQALETSEQKKHLGFLIGLVLRQSEVDLGVDWQPPTFVRTGARLLDTHLVNEPLRWLSAPKFTTVREPFKKGLSHFLEAEKKPHLLGDVVTDMYESLEALAKVVTGRETKDLSANAELFIKSIKASDHYKLILKDYISYANQFRHAAKQEGTRPKLSITEVESFVYLTGLIIRLAIQS